MFARRRWHYVGCEQNMKMATSVLILPGLGDSGPEHWQSCWERRDASCTRVIQDEWDQPVCADWVARLNQAMEAQTGSVVFAAHSSACALVVHWAAAASSSNLARIKGALLVAPSDPSNPNYPHGPSGFGPVPSGRLPFDSIVVASSDDRYIAASEARRYAEAWGSRLVMLENAGHINAASGFGAWPDGYALLTSLRSPVVASSGRAEFVS